MDSDFAAIKILPSPTFENYYDQAHNILFLKIAEDTVLLDDIVFVPTSKFKDIIGSTKRDLCNSKKRHSIVKITNGSKSIHRTLRAISTKDFSGNKIAMTSNSLYLLSEQGVSPDKINEVTIDNGCKFCYYWFHPFHATRISYKLGLLGLMIGIASSILGILSLFK